MPDDLDLQELLQHCAREPIHLPGSIQPHGALLALDTSAGPVRYASDNLDHFFGCTARDALGRTLPDLLGAEAAAAVATAEERGQHGSFPITVRPDGHAVRYACRVHRQAGHVILDVEPLQPDEERALPGLATALAELLDQPTLEDACRRAVAHIHEHTGYEHVMMYRFHPNWDGEVIAEAVGDHLPGYLGLRFPASDIPAQARALYHRNWLRIIPDAGYTPVPLLSTDAAPLDLSFSGLRSVSPVHLTYLHNMGVGASMSISLLEGDRLWGLIACHHPTPRRLSQTLRDACVFYARQFSAHLTLTVQRERQSYLDRYEELLRHPLRAMNTRADDVAIPLRVDEPGLCALVDAGGLVLRYAGQTHTRGRVPPPEHLSALISWIMDREIDALWHTDHLAAHYPDAAAIQEVASGLLVVKLSRNDFLAWCKPEVARTVYWSGNPNKPVRTSERDNTLRLSPRASFALWQEELRGHATPWADEHLQAAQVLRRNLLEAIATRSAVEAAHQRGRSEAAALTLHDIGNALTGISGRVVNIQSRLEDTSFTQHLEQLITFLEPRQEGLDAALGEGKGQALLTMLQALNKDHQTSIASIQENNQKLTTFLTHAKELLDINRAYAGMGDDPGRHAFSVLTVLRDVATMTSDSVRRHGGTLALDVEPGLPRLNLDRSRLVQVLLNLVKNAYEAWREHDEPEGAPFRLCLAAHRTPPGGLCIEIRDDGSGFSREEHARLFQRGYSTKQRGTGLGLHGSRNVIESLGGTLTLSSPGPAEGTTARIRFPASIFEHA